LVESWAENLIENVVGNWVKNWVDNYEQEIDRENLVCFTHDFFDSIKNSDDSSTPDCRFWSMDYYSIRQKLHSCCLVIFFELGKLDILQRHDLVHGNNCNLDLSFGVG